MGIHRSMKHLGAAAVLATLLGGCSVYREATSTRMPTADNWRPVATTADRDRLRTWRDAWDAAIADAKDIDGGAIAADPKLFDPDRALTDPLPPAGTYRCRTIKIGKAGAAMPGFVAYPAETCTIQMDGQVRRFSEQNGEQRPSGLIYSDVKGRAIFLGSLTLGDETAPLRYGLDDKRDMIGIVEQVDPRRWRIVLPWPHFQSKLDIIELIPAR